MNIPHTGNSRAHSLEELADHRTRDTEFAEIMQLLRVSPRTQNLSDHDLEKHARAAWAKFDDAPVRSFVAVFVEREVLRVVARTAAGETLAPPAHMTDRAQTCRARANPGE